MRGQFDSDGNDLSGTDDVFRQQALRAESFDIETILAQRRRNPWWHALVRAQATGDGAKRQASFLGGLVEEKGRDEALDRAMLADENNATFHVLRERGPCHHE